MDYLLIFVAELVEVSFFTLKVVFISKGEKIKGTIAAFFEVLIWVYVMNAVLDDVLQNPVKVVLFCMAYALGNLLGTVIESKISRKK